MAKKLESKKEEKAELKLSKSQYNAKEKKEGAKSTSKPKRK